MVWVTYDPGAPFPQGAQFGRGVESSDGQHTPPAGMASFSVDLADLAEGTDETLYEVTAPDTLTVRADAEALKVAERQHEWLHEGDPVLGQGGRLRREMSFRLWVHWSPVEQLNAVDSTYPPDQLEQLRTDKAAMLDEYHRVKALIEAATTTAEIDAAVASVNWPLSEVV